MACLQTPLQTRLLSQGKAKQVLCGSDHVHLGPQLVASGHLQKPLANSLSRKPTAAGKQLRTELVSIERSAQVNGAVCEWAPYCLLTTVLR